MAQSKSLGACWTMTNWNVLVFFFFLFSVTRFKTRMCQHINFVLVYKIPFEDKFTMEILYMASASVGLISLLI